MADVLEKSSLLDAVPPLGEPFHPPLPHQQLQQEAAANAAPPAAPQQQQQQPPPPSHQQPQQQQKPATARANQDQKGEGGP
nr:LOW QUALITY PROTEIN: protein Tob1-like [Drosophila suzukii]